MDPRSRFAGLVRSSRWLGAAVAAASVVCFTGGGFCVPIPDNVVRSTIDDSPIDLVKVDAILSDSTLTEVEKQERLTELGVPADLITTLLASAAQ